MVAEVTETLGTVDILVNNAGITRPQKIEDITENDWDELIDANLKSAFLVTQAVLPAMRTRRWGRIINMSSVAAQTGGLVGPHYAASKAGMLGLTHSYAGLLAKEGITVNTIAPALIATAMVMTNPRATPEVIPVGRFGTVDEVAEVVVTLAKRRLYHGADHQRQRRVVLQLVRSILISSFPRLACLARTLLSQQRRVYCRSRRAANAG